MILDNHFHVALPPERVSPLLLDLERVAPCLPGAAITGRVDEHTYRGTITIRVGPVTVSYAGTAKLLEVDPGSGRMVMRCEGRETRGPGSATADSVIEMAADQGGSAGHIRSDIAVTGRVAQFGRGMMAEVGDRLLTQFARCLEASVADMSSAQGGEASPPGSGGTPPDPPSASQPQLDMLRIVIGILWDRLRFWRSR
ncbi:MAG: SRPBCC family protein [Candidatus Dormibacteria bacterium]